MCSLQNIFFLKVSFYKLNETEQTSFNPLPVHHRQKASYKMQLIFNKINKTMAPEQDKQDLRNQFANSKKNPSQSLSFAFHASSFSINKQNEPKVPRSLRSVVQRAPPTHQRRKSDSIVPRPGLQRKASTPSVHVNPPTFALARGKRQGSVRETMGVPMLSIAEDHGSKKKTSDQASFRIKKSHQRKSSRGAMTVSPPAMAVTKGGTSRTRKTLGVPMV